jgi:hypothetical protein
LTAFTTPLEVEKYFLSFFTSSTAFTGLPPGRDNMLPDECR